MKIEVKVIAGAKKREVKREGTGLKLKVLAKREKGKANEEVIEVLAETLGVARRDVRIVVGEKDTRKIVSVPIDQTSFDALLGSLQ